jgi:hypothetical protein
MAGETAGSGATFLAVVGVVGVATLVMGALAVIAACPADQPVLAVLVVVEDMLLSVQAAVVVVLEFLGKEATAPLTEAEALADRLVQTSMAEHMEPVGAAIYAAAEVTVQEARSALSGPAQHAPSRQPALEIFNQKQK